MELPVQRPWGKSTWHSEGQQEFHVACAEEADGRIWKD